MPSLDVDPNKTWAVLIGTSQFDNPGIDNRNEKLLPLPAVTNNLRELEQLLADPKIVGLPSDNIKLVLNASTDTDILPELNDAISKAQDTLIVYYAGHGVLDNDRKLFLATKNTVKLNPIGSSALAFSKMQTLVNNAKANKIIIILDCCFSGRATGEFQQRGRKQVFILASSFDTEASIAPLGETFTAFTGELISLLTNGIADHKGETFTLADIKEYLAMQLSVKEHPNISQFPEPKEAIHAGAGRLKIAYNVQRTASEGATPVDNCQCHLDLEKHFPKFNCRKVVSTCHKRFSKDNKQGDTAIFLLQDCLLMCGKMCLAELENGLQAKAKEIRRYSVAFDIFCQPNQIELLNRLAGHVGISPNSQQDPNEYAKDILKRIGDSLRNSGIVLFDFGNFHYLPSPEEFLTWLVQDFWRLVESELSKIAQRGHYYVKFICVITTDKEIKLNLPRIVNLPLRKWTVTDIQDWLDRHATMPTGTDTARIADTIYETTKKGTPHLVYQRLQELAK